MKNIITILIGLCCSMGLWAADLTGVKIYLNPGHGGFDGDDRNVVTISYAQGDTLGFWESSSNLRKGLVLRDMLEAANATVIMSRTLNRSEDDRDLSEVAEEANANAVDAFLSLHTNAYNKIANYLLLLYHGYDNDPTVAESLPMANTAWPRLVDNGLTVWTNYATSTNCRGDFSFYDSTSGLIVLRSLTVPGFLSEASFHDYPPETHRLLSPAYGKMIAANYYRYFCDYFNADLPSKGIIAGWVKGQGERIKNSLFTYATGSNDQWLPLNGAQVKLMSAAGDSLDMFQVDTLYNGVFVFFDLEPGSYKLSFTAAKHDAQETEVTVEAGKTSYVRQFLVNPNPPDDGEIPPDYPDPDQEAGVIAMTQYQFGTPATQALDGLEGATVRKVLYRDEKYYILTEEPKILVLNANNLSLIREMDLTGISGGVKTLSDINFTSDGYLLACNKDTIDYSESRGRYFKVYAWDNDDAAPAELFRTQVQANWNTGVVGETFAVSGARWKCRLYVPSVTAGSSKQIRIMGLQYEKDYNLGYKFMLDTAKYKEGLWGQHLKFTISPSGSDYFYLDSELSLPVEYRFNWDAADRSPLEEERRFEEQGGYELAQVAAGNFFFRHAQHVFMASPVCAADSTEAGLVLFDITQGIDMALKVSEKLDGYGTQPAKFMAASALVKGYDLTLGILTDQGLRRYSTLIPEVKANIYASELKFIEDPEKAFGFTLNEDADNVSIDLYKEETLVKTIELGALNKGVHSVPADLEGLEDGTYSWSVTAEAEYVDRPVKISDDTQVQMQIYSPRGVAVDNEFDSPFFGRVYASETAGGKVTNRETQDGIYILNAALEDVTNQGVSSYTGNVTWGAGSSPMRLCVAPDGKVYLTDWSDTHSGIWIMDPANPSGNFTEVFAGLTPNDDGLVSNGSVNVHGSIPHCWVTGTGDDTRLFTFDEDYTDAIATNPGNLLQYNIGKLETPWTQAPSAIVYNNGLHGNLQQNMNSCIAPDGRDGWWVSQYRDADDAVTPSLIHVNTLGEVDFNSGKTPRLIENSYTGGMAVNYEANLLAMGCNNEVKIFSIVFSEEGIPSLTRLHSIKPAMGANTCGLSFDRAGNLYVISNSSKRLGVWALPKIDNRFTTPAPASQSSVAVGESSIDKVSVLADKIVVSPNPATDYIQIDAQGVLLKAVSLYTTAGRLVKTLAVNQTNTARLYLDDLPPGMYIVQIQTPEGTVSKKVVKR